MYSMLLFFKHLPKPKVAFTHNDIHPGSTSPQVCFIWFITLTLTIFDLVTLESTGVSVNVG